MAREKDDVEQLLMDLSDNDVPARQQMARTTVAVEGMTCGACTAAIEGGFKGIDGVDTFTISLITERAVAIHDVSKVSAEKVAEM